MFTKRYLLVATVVTALVFSISTTALAEPFSVSLNVGGQVINRTFASQEEAASFLNENRMREVVPNYTAATPISGTITQRGIVGQISVPDLPP